MNNGADEVEKRRALEQALASAAFSRNERQSRFLTFLVERHLEGRDGELKESVIAVEVFDRKPDYDPKVDAIVRTEAVRLRTRLSTYYASEGRLDPIVIELPKGRYRPVFTPRAVAPVEAEPVPASRRAVWAAGTLVAIVALAGAAAWWFWPAAAAPTTVAVLPLENLSQDPATDYFADGLTDEIIRNLSVIDGLTVRSRTSSFALRGKGLNAVEAGRQLGAEYLVEGSVLQAGDQLRVNVAMVAARDGSRMWSGRYDRTLTDVFSIQDEISRGIVDTLRLRLSGRRRYEANLEAYDLYLRGRQIMAGFPARGRPVAPAAVEYFERAIARDPNYAIAYAGMADAFIAVERNMGAANTIDAWPRAKVAAARALELDPLLSEAHAAMAAIHAREYAWQDAERGFHRAIALNPNNALARLELGLRVLALQGRVEESLEEVRRALALDPLSPYVNTEAGSALLLAGRYEEAVEQFRKAIALDPSRTRPYNAMARALYLAGRTGEALEARDQSVKRGAAPGVFDWAVCVEARAGRRKEALDLLHELKKDLRRHGAFARAYACLGDHGQALAALEEAIAKNDPDVSEILQSPELASLRGHPRFVALRKTVNLGP